jgi:tetratricopeptide (TPR) repeat protein
MSQKIIRQTIFLPILMVITMGWVPAQAQMPPSAPQPGTTVPAATTVPVTSGAAAATAPNLESTVSADYIWFGNDQINQAVQLIRSNRSIEALDILDGIVKVNMRLAEAHLIRGVAFLQLKNIPQAEQAFNTVLAIDRGYLGAYVYLSQIAVQKGNPAQIEMYLQAIKTVCQGEDCAEYRYVKNTLRSVPGAVSK